MPRNTEARIAKLEEAARRTPASAQAVHRLLARPGDDEAAMIASMVSTGSAKAGDLFIVRRMVRPAG